jgi:secondary thiamine-phosphate synthase enzyme
MPLNHRYELIFLLVFILAFFPSVFQLLLKPVLWPFELFGLGSPIAPSRRILPVCACCPPADCYPTTTAIPVAQAIPASTMAWTQKQFTLASRSRGSYLITDEVMKQLPEIKDYKIGLLNLFIQHTSCALSLNENYDTDVRADMSDALDRLAPEDKKGELYRHADEGLDDMPAHIKSALVGASVTVPISNGRLNTGTWQGIWYLEFRASKHARRVVATIQGEKNA